MKLFKSLDLLYRSQGVFKASLILYLLLFILGSIVLGLLEAGSVRLVGPLLAALNSQTSYGPDEINGVSILKSASIRFLIVAAIAAVWRLLILWSAVTLGSQLTSNIGNTFYRELTSQDYQSFIQYDQSELISRFSIDLERIRACYTTFLNLLSSLFLGLFLVAELFLVDARATLSCLLIFVLFYSSISIFVQSSLIVTGRQARASASQQINLLGNLFSSLYLLKNGRLRETYLYSYSSNERMIRKLYSRLQFLSSYPRILVEGIGILILLIIIPLFNNEAGLRILPLLGVYGAGFYKLLPTLQAIYSNWNEYAANESFLIAVHEHVQELIRRRQTSKPQGFSIMPKASINNLEQPLISFKNVHFRYASSEKYTILGVDHDSFYGDRVLITGPSGSGKSTYVDLLTGMLSPSSGIINISQELLRTPPNIEVNDIEARDLLTNACEHVPSKPFIFNRSLAYNIALRPDDEIDEPRLLECIKIVKLEASLRRLDIYSDNPNQILNTENISNGERQKVGIARALYGNPKILILDESLNSLDRESSIQILENITAKSSASIIYLISHQPIIDDWETQQITFNDGILSNTSTGLEHMN